jgi:hypothetical protein
MAMVRTMTNSPAMANPALLLLKSGDLDGADQDATPMDRPVMTRL